MSVATLLNAADPAFDFEHQRAHNRMLATAGPSSSNFSGQPYWLDPAYGDTTVPAGWGNTLHTQAHQDFINLFPAPFGGNSTSDLNDISLFPEPDAWWQFSNFQMHYIAAQIP